MSRANVIEYLNKIIDIRKRPHQAFFDDLIVNRYSDEICKIAGVEERNRIVRDLIKYQTEHNDQLTVLKAIQIVYGETR